MAADLPMRSSRNKHGYLGQSIELDRELAKLRNQSKELGWITESLSIDSDESLLFMHRSASSECCPSILITGGIHGDEPATTASISKLILDDLLPKNGSYTVFPCLNPRGMRISSRETPEGKDLNRDFRKAETIEVQTELNRLQPIERFDIALMLHEDWEADGFYLYELTEPDAPPKFGRKVLDAVSQVCPVEKSPMIEGLEADKGLIHPPYHERKRPDWPEAFYLMRHKTNHSLTLESPSDFDMEVRIEALNTAVLAAVKMLTD